MPLTLIDYVTGEPNLVIRVDKCPPNGVENVTPASGTVTTGSAGNQFSATLVEAPQSQAVPAQGFAWGLYSWAVIAPVDSTGTMPDAEFTFQIGNYQPLDVVVRADYDANMFPDPRHLRAGRREQVTIGVDLRRLYLDSGGAAVNNVPLQLAGVRWIPATYPFGLRVKSQAGWGQNGTALSPLIFVGWLTILSDSQLQQLWPWLVQQTAFGMDYGPGGNVSGQFTWPSLTGAPTSDDVISRFPGGPKDEQIKFLLTSATNALAIPSNQRYVYSQKTAITGGNPQNVSDVRYDLGHALKGTNQAFVPTLFGLRFASSLFTSGNPLPSLYLSWGVDGNVVPNPHENGVLITAGTNYLQWGSTPPILNDTGEYFPMSGVGQFAKVLNYGQNIAPQVYAPSGFAANTIRLLLGGYRIATPTLTGTPASTVSVQ